MKENELTIEIPNGKIVDWDKSKKLNKIVFKTTITYNDVCKKLFENKKVFYTGSYGNINSTTNFDMASCYGDKNNATTYHQLECLLAKNMLANVAVYLNDGWKPNRDSHVFVITHYGDVNRALIVEEYIFGNGENLIVFKTQKDALQAIEILGEETVKLALEPLGI